jgi:secernin
MCDTMVVLPGCTSDGSLLFAKNSDREPNEPHIILKVPRRSIKPGEGIKCTYISVVNSEGKELVTNKAILFKPSWIWGAEMGVNDKGVVIGNEAVFTREKVEDNTLLGMDILRLALEMCSSAREALNYITVLIEKYGQGGKAGYTQNLKYHNSYLIADFEEAYVLETSGRHWVYDKVKDIRSISNTLSIRNQFEGCSSRLVEYALAKGRCRSREEFDFKRCFESRLHPHFTRGDVRRSTAEKHLRGKLGALGVNDMKAVLRSHNGDGSVEGFKNGSMECICMHAGGGIITSQTTGSFIVQLKEGKINIWATGSSIPCISVFKPLWFTEAGSGFINADASEGSTVFWKYVERKHRAILDGSIQGLEVYLQKRDQLEEELSKLAAEAATDEARAKVTEYAFISEKRILDELSFSSNSNEGKGSMKLFYRMYWKRQNRAFERVL